MNKQKEIEELLKKLDNPKRERWEKKVNNFIKNWAPEKGIEFKKDCMRYWDENIG